MKLYFFRHAIAEDDPSGVNDHKRKLTAKGIERTKTAAKALAAMGVKLSRLYTSPLTRARQTADLLAPVLGAAVQVRSELSPGFNLEMVEKLVHDLGNQDTVMFVGHEPDFSATIAALTGGAVQMRKGGLARVDITAYKPLRGELVWLITPKGFDLINETKKADRKTLSAKTRNDQPDDDLPF